MPDKRRMAALLIEMAIDTMTYLTTRRLQRERDEARTALAVAKAELAALAADTLKNERAIEDGFVMPDA